MRLTEYRRQEIDRIHQCLKQQIGGQKVSAESIAAAMQKQCSNLDYETSLSICSRIGKGVEEFCRICKDRDALLAKDYVEEMLDGITEQMDKQQRKGFYLQALDSFEKNQASAEEIANRAALPEEDLKILLAQKMREFSKSAAFEMSDVLEDSCFQKEERTAKHKTELTQEDAFLFAAAEYIAVLDGVLPYEFGESPELLGICATAQMTMTQLCAGCTQENGDEYSEIVEILICAAVGAAFAIGAAVIGVAAAPVLEMMAFGTLGTIVSILIATTLYMTFILGCLSLICGLAMAIGAGVEKWKDSDQAKKESSHRIEKEVDLKKEETYMQKQEVVL